MPPPLNPQKTVLWLFLLHCRVITIPSSSHYYHFSFLELSDGYHFKFFGLSAMAFKVFLGFSVWWHLKFFGAMCDAVMGSGLINRLITFLRFSPQAFFIGPQSILQNIKVSWWELNSQMFNRSNGKQPQKTTPHRITVADRKWCEPKTGHFGALVPL